MMQMCEPELHVREFKEFQKLIYTMAGIHLADTKVLMVQGRLAKRLRALKLETYEQYLRFLKAGDSVDESTHFINSLTTNKTDFFREAHHFEFLTNVVFPRLVKRAAETGDKVARIWSSASSTGEEPYSIAMCAAEFFGRHAGWEIKILATDIDTNVLATAAEATYYQDRIEDIPHAYRSRYLHKVSADEYQVIDELRNQVHFHQLNLLGDHWPFRAQFDVIFCRNVMIYFDVPSQKKLIEHFANYLRSDGNLIIGHSESLFGISDRFKLLGDTAYSFAGGDLANQKTSGSSTIANQAPSKPASALEADHATRQKKVTLPNEAFQTRNQQATDRDVEHPRNAIHRATQDTPKVPIIVGEIHASAEPVWITTTLGSCVSVCLFDEFTQIGGMNHFMLPKSDNDTQSSCSFGVHAMELLVNQIMRLGGDRRRLKAKLFGGSAVLDKLSGDIGQKNLDFAREFLQRECIPLIGEHTGGTLGMQIFFNSATTKVYLRELDHSTSTSILSQEQIAAQRLLSAQRRQIPVTLF